MEVDMGGSGQTNGRVARRGVADQATSVLIPDVAEPFMEFEAYKAEISCRQAAIYLTICANPGFSTGAIATALGLSKPAVTRATIKLIGLRLVRREIDLGDRRMVKLYAGAGKRVKKGGR